MFYQEIRKDGITYNRVIPLGEWKRKKNQEGLKPRVAELTFHRDPTDYEIYQGLEHEQHKNFKLDLCLRENGDVKQWIRCPDDGLRYYYF